MTREGLADRLVNYSDAVAAFAVVNSLAFLLALSEAEVRCSLIPVEWLVYAGQAFVGVVITAVLLWLGSVERSLRAGSPTLPSDVRTLLGRFAVARYVIVWAVVGLTAALSILPLADTSCPPMAD